MDESKIKLEIIRKMIVSFFRTIDVGNAPGKYLYYVDNEYAKRADILLKNIREIVDEE